MVSPDPAEAIAGLKSICGEFNVLTDQEDMAAYSVDWKGTTSGTPLCVVRPGTTAEVADVIRLCGRHGISVVPQGGNTGLAAGAVPDESGTQILLSLNRINAIHLVDRVGMTISAGAGCVLQTAQEAAREAGRYLPISLAAEGTAQLGGIVATNAGGLNVVRYGMARGFVLGLEVVLADGTVVDGMRQLRKDNAGFDWKHLFIGCEGTFGIITGVVLRLVPEPKFKATALLAVKSVDDAVALLVHLQQEVGDVVTSFELISRQSMQLVTEHYGEPSPFDSDWYVLAETAASLPGLHEAFEATLVSALESEIASDAVVAQSQDQASRLWKLRELVTESEHKAGGTVKHDVSVPIDCLPGFVRDAEAALKFAFPQIRVSAFGHLGDGNLHYNVLPFGAERLAVTRIVHDVIARYDGSISAEHGIGTYRLEELQRYKAQSELALAMAIKRTLDPDCLLNPGKLHPLLGDHHPARPTE